MLAIITARGGSKGIPKKNIVLLNGKPLIAYSIEAAKKAKYVDRVIVSTDDPEIAEVSKKYGAEVPFLRPKELAQDDSPGIGVYLHVLNEIKSRTGEEIKSFVVLLPTSPLRTHEDIDNAIKTFLDKDADSVISVRETPIPLSWFHTMNEKGALKLCHNEKGLALKNRQEEEKQYVRNGSIFVFKAELIENKRNYYSNKTYAYIMPEERSIDIDTVLDLKFAEDILRENKFS